MRPRLTIILHCARRAFGLLGLLAFVSLAASDASAQRGGRGGGSARPTSMPSPADMIKQQVEGASPFEFFNEHRKQLSLTNVQRDSFKVYEKELDKARDPLLKDVYKHAPKTMTRGADAMPDTVRTLVSALSELNKTYELRAYAQLDSAQRDQAELLHVQWMVNKRANRGRP